MRRKTACFLAWYSATAPFAGAGSMIAPAVHIAAIASATDAESPDPPWPMAEPVAAGPPSVSHIPGTIAEKYGPHTPGTNFASLDTAIAQLDVPQIRASRVSRSAPPSKPSPPACASMIEIDTAVPSE